MTHNLKAVIDIETKKITSRWFILLGVLAIAMVIYVQRLVDWQIINGEYYKEKAISSSSYVVKTDAKRGEILDVNGQGLAINETGYKIVFDHLYMDDGSENNIILNLIKLMKLKNEKWIDELPIYISSSGSYEFVSDKDDDIAALKKTLKLNSYATAQNCMDKMIEKYDCRDYSQADQKNICSVRYNMTKNGYEQYKTKVYTFADGVSQETVSIVSELTQSSMQGVEIQGSTIRKYVKGTLAPHIVGLVGKLSEEEYEKLKDRYSLDDTIGKSGIEAAMEDHLRGTSGRKLVEANENGSVVNTVETKNADPGHTVFLTIDSDIQNAANESLAKNVESAKRSSARDCKSGAVVVLNVKDFSVLAAGTYPTYDQQKYIDDNDYYNKIVTDLTYTPLVNRAFNGAFTPGSIYKPVVACAGLEEGVIREDETINCSGAYTYYADSGFVIKCMGVHGNSALRNSLAKSCNVFFAETGRRVGIETLDLYAKRFGLGSKTGVEVYESKGVLAGPEYSKEMGGVWYDGNTSQAAIGQSDNMFTPIQLAVYTGIIANGGNRYKTHLISKITDYTRKNLIMQNDPDNPELIENVGISEKNLNIVREGMRAVVTSGTATDFRSYPIEIAAKTGTAENVGSDHTTFICYAPYQDPEIAISVVIEHGASGKWSKNVARDVLDAYFAKKAASNE